MTGQIGRAGGGRARHSDQLRLGDNQGRDSSRRCGKQITNLTRRTALIGLSTFVVLPGRAQTTPTADAAESVSLEQPETFEIPPTTGTLKETVQKGQQLLWGGTGWSTAPRFRPPNMSVARIRKDPTGQVAMTSAGLVSSLVYPTVEEPKLTVLVRTKGGASIPSWSLAISVRCAERSRPLAPV